MVTYISHKIGHAALGCSKMNVTFWPFNLVKLLIVSTACIMLTTNTLYAQPSNTSPDDYLARKKQNPAYEVLGRELTRKEQDLYGNVNKEELKSSLLHREQRLVAVRALVAIGASEDIREIIDILPLTKLRTYVELLTYFSHLQEKYGSVLDGIKAEYVYNIVDDEQAFRQAAGKAYEITFGIPKEKQSIEDIVNFFKAKEAFTYSRMVAELVATMEEADKQRMLFKALDEIGRPDLKGNEKFVRKILEQDFTHESLKALLEQIPAK